MSRLRESPRYSDSRCLIRHGGRVYSQNDEDGIIGEIFKRIGVETKTFVEIGTGPGLQNNTLALLVAGWKGIWVEADRQCALAIEKGLGPVLETGRLRLINTAATAENIDEILRSAAPGPCVDLLSIDIDGNDFHVLDAIRSLQARVLVLEYNSKFPPPLRYCQEYEPERVWDGSDHWGASLEFLAEKVSARGYRLVGCCLAGVNAFFVREDLVGDAFLPPFDAEQHFEPSRLWTALMPQLFPTSYEAIVQMVRKDVSING